MMLARETETALKTTALHALHAASGGKMVPFAGYDMPVQYRRGVLKEHLHTRNSAGLFDVSHMGQLELRAKSGKVEDAALALERLVPQDILAVAPGRQRYAQFTNDAGGILDDLMVANLGRPSVPGGQRRLQGRGRGASARHSVGQLRHRAARRPRADRAAGAEGRCGAGAALPRSIARCGSWMRGRDRVDGIDCFVSRSGYTGEDGFEISVPADAGGSLRADPAGDADVMPIGLGARDSLRLEAGLCLYGHDIDTTTTPVEAALEWAIQKSRRHGGARAGGFPGADAFSRSSKEARRAAASA